MSESLTQIFVCAWPSGKIWAIAYERTTQIHGGPNGKGSGEEVALKWQNGDGAYFGIVDSEGNLGLDVNHPIYMEQLTEDPKLRLVKLRSYKWEKLYLTGHSDSSVDGRPDDLDPTATYWRILTAPFNSSHILLQFYNMVHRTKDIKNGVFLVIYKHNDTIQYKIEQYSEVKEHGVFSF